MYSKYMGKVGHNRSEFATEKTKGHNRQIMNTERTD